MADGERLDDAISLELGAGVVTEAFRPGSAALVKRHLIGPSEDDNAAHMQKQFDTGFGCCLRHTACALDVDGSVP